MTGRAFVGGLVVAESLNNAFARGRAVAAARREEHDHFGTAAQLSAALAAIKKMDPQHPLNSQKVLDQIDAHGQRASTFSEAWIVKFDPGLIYSELMKIHETQRSKAVAQIEKAVISHRQPGWFSSECFILFSTKFDTAEAAQAAKGEILRLARGAGLDDSLDPAQILRAVAEANLKLMEPVAVAVPRGPRPPARAFRRRKM